MSVATILITATRSGSPSTVVVNRGPAGATGPQGDPGPQGAVGVVAADSPLDYDAPSQTVKLEDGAPNVGQLIYWDGSQWAEVSVVEISEQNGNVGIGGPPSTASYKLRVHGAIWADSLQQLTTLAGASGVGNITYYDEGGTLNFEAFGPHAAETVKGLIVLRSQDIFYTSLANAILHADADFADHPSLLVRSRQAGADSWLMINYHHALGCLVTTQKEVGGDASIRFRPARAETFVVHETGDIEVTGQGNGLVLTDRTLGTRHRVYLDAGVLEIEPA